MFIRARARTNGAAKFRRAAAPKNPPRHKTRRAGAERLCTAGGLVTANASGGWCPPEYRTQRTPSARLTSKSWTESPTITAASGSKRSSAR